MMLLLAAREGPMCFLSIKEQQHRVPQPLALLGDQLALEATQQLTSAPAVTQALVVAAVIDK